MPELPEVETIRRQLLSLCRDQVIDTVTVKTPYLLKNCTAAVFQDALQGRRVKDLSRIGKYLIWECEEVYPVFHLGMSGIFLLDRRESRYPQHIHVEIRFAAGLSLYFQDMRKFGKIWLYPHYPEIPTLGTDPITGSITPMQLRNWLQRRNTTLKQFLMNQTPIAGIGNIYASEILFESCLSPYRKSDELTAAEAERLLQAIGRILNDAIERFGTTYSAYRTVNGQSGENQNFLKVYQRDGQPCVKCGETIIKTVMGSRSTFYCPRCQR